jgi:hypothetical protein
VETTKLVLRDDAGKVRAALFQGKNGPKLDFYDEKGNLRALMGFGFPGRAAVVLLSSQEHPLAILDTMGDIPTVELYDTGRHVRVRMAAIDKGGKLAFLDEAGKERTSLNGGGAVNDLRINRTNGQQAVTLALAGEMPSLHLNDAAGKARIAVDLPSGNPNVTLRDARGENRMGIGLVKGETPVLFLFDAEGKTRLGLDVTGKGPHFYLQDARGKDLFSKP